MDDRVHIGCTIFLLNTLEEILVSALVIKASWLKYVF